MPKNWNPSPHYRAKNHGEKTHPNPCSSTVIVNDHAESHPAHFLIERMNNIITPQAPSWAPRAHLCTPAELAAISHFSAINRRDYRNFVSTKRARAPTPPISLHPRRRFSEFPVAAAAGGKIDGARRASSLLYRRASSGGAKCSRELARNFNEFRFYGRSSRCAGDRYVQSG